MLSVRHIAKTFGGIAALADVSLELLPGQVHALVGENGAGKSTLIKVLTGVYRADAGTIEYDGAEVRFARPLDAQLAGISTIYQEINLVPLISVARNVFLGREPRNRLGLVDFRTMNAQARRLLAQVGVTVDVRRPLRSLGTGTQQMVAIARAVSTEAKVVIMDEPTSSLEPREVAKLFGVIEQLTASGIAVLYVSHKLDELYRIAQQVTVLRDGAVVHTGKISELPRLQLISHMLGRDIAQVQRQGVTAFDDRSGADPDAAEQLLDARGLSKRHQISDIDLSVAPGEIVGLGGLLGAGRSETVRAIAGATKLDAGEVRVRGRKIRNGSTAVAIGAGIALLTEDRKADGIIPGLSVRENIVLAAMPRLSKGGVVSTARQRAVVDIFMKRLRIKASSPEQKVSELSGGNQQKVLLARWLCLSPQLLLLDEPTRGIDVGAKAEVQALVAELAAEGLGVVLISSELEELIEGSDRIVALRDGRVVGELRGDAVTENALLTLLSGEPAANPDPPPEPAADVPDAAVPAADLPVPAERTKEQR
ncbi:sugar ABC transporter ATP-binding protein [Nakamurella sp. DB0629]|uniref:Sugar ABC transporter ATP-binding protein n=1 Tax=Nakamurella aerolata TaxID=1656892 RepID=A0A849A421_9ACTN|nr:sugar ABC transporter ATP-binding protein [Nakamurella aerolata]